jgi:hypothetical protein
MEPEIVKLLNVLRRIARASAYASWTKAGTEATQFLVAQYNRVLARLVEIEPAATALFTPLSDSSSPEVIRIACRELFAYFEDEPEVVRAFHFLGGRRRRRSRMRCVPITIPCD